MRTTPVCAYCGKLWEQHKGGAKDIPEDIAESVQKHIQVCPKNPLVQQIAQLKAELDEVKLKNINISDCGSCDEYKRGCESAKMTITQLKAELEKLTALAKYVLNCGLISRMQAAKVSGFSYKELDKYQAKSESEADEIIRKGAKKNERLCRTDDIKKR